MPSLCVFSGANDPDSELLMSAGPVIDARATLQTDLVRKSNPTVK